MLSAWCRVGHSWTGSGISCATRGVHAERLWCQVGGSGKPPGTATLRVCAPPCDPKTPIRRSLRLQGHDGAPPPARLKRGRRGTLPAPPAPSSGLPESAKAASRSLKQTRSSVTSRAIRVRSQAVGPSPGLPAPQRRRNAQDPAPVPGTPGRRHGHGGTGSGESCSSQSSESSTRLLPFRSLARSRRPVLSRSARQRAALRLPTAELRLRNSQFMPPVNFVPKRLSAQLSPGHRRRLNSRPA